MISGALALQGQSPDAQGTSDTDIKSAETIRPFHVNIPDADLKDLRKRIHGYTLARQRNGSGSVARCATRETPGTRHYWGTEYDWRKGEEKLNAFPQFMTMIDGLDIHFIHVKSPHPNAMPLIITHGWPGSVFEQIKLIGPLTDPTKYGGRAEDAFDVVIPSLPGFGFSGQPTEAGWGLERIGVAWDVLMKRIRIYKICSAGWRLGCRCC